MMDFSWKLNVAPSHTVHSRGNILKEDKKFSSISILLKLFNKNLTQTTSNHEQTITLPEYEEVRE